MLDERKSLAVKHRFFALLPLEDLTAFEPLHEHRRATTQQLQSMLVDLVNFLESDDWLAQARNPLLLLLSVEENG